MNLDYNYGPAGSPNNGRVSQITDHVSGEQVTYQYDALNRMFQATTASGAWGLNFQYDGFGNLMGQTAAQGTPPVFTATIDPTTNRRVDAGYAYDGNGNQTSAPGGVTYSYDGANRMISGPNWSVAAYDENNRRVWDGSYIYYYAPNGQLLAKYRIVSGGYQQAGWSVWFGSKLIRQDGKWVVQDRLGSVRANGNGERFNYYPYGQEMQATADGRTKFATYFRDGNGLDYADQRYYANTGGRFLTPDPSLDSNALELPGNWNKYAYVGGDPINKNDPRGLCSPNDDPPCYSVTGTGSASPDPGSPSAGPPGEEEPRPDPGGDQNGSGTSHGSTLNILLGASVKRIQGDLNKPDCARDFKNMNKVDKELGKVGFKNLGQLQFTTSNGQVVPTDSSGPDAQSNMFTGSINLNSNINWDNPSGNSSGASVDFAGQTTPNRLLYGG